MGFLREDLVGFLPNPRSIDAFEAQFAQVQDNTEGAANAQNTADQAIAATDNLKAATYLTLSANTELTSERIFTAGNLMSVSDGGAGADYTVSVDKLTIAGAFTIALTLTANSALTLPTAGTLATLAGAESLSNKTLDQVRTAQTATATADIPATHKVPIKLNGTDYFILLST